MFLRKYLLLFLFLPGFQASAGSSDSCRAAWEQKAALTPWMEWIQKEGFFPKRRTPPGARVNEGDLKPKADRGDIRAMLDLAFFYRNKRRYAEALKYFEKAFHEKQSGLAAMELSLLKLEFNDLKTAFSLMSAAAEQGYAHARVYLSVMRYLGIGAAASVKEARQELEEASKALKYEALLKAAEKVSAVIKKTAPARFVKGSSEWLEWARRSFPPPLQKSFAQLKEAAEQGSTEAFIELGFAYKHRGDYSRAFKFFERAGAQSSSLAFREMALMYMRGSGGRKPIDSKKAFELMMDAYQLGGDHFTEAYLAWMYFYGAGVKKNKQKAREWIQRLRRYVRDDSMFYIAQATEKKSGSRVLNKN